MDSVVAVPTWVGTHGVKPLNVDVHEMAQTKLQCSKTLAFDFRLISHNLEMVGI